MANSSYVNILFTALGGIDGSVMPIIWFIAASILTVTFLGVFTTLSCEEATSAHWAYQFVFGSDSASPIVAAAVL